MGKAFLKKTTSLLQAKRKRKRWQRTMISLSLVVAMVTSCLLIHPAITMERTAICGQEEHTHTKECYEHRLVCGKTEQSAVPATEEKVLNCSKAVHEHGEGCYDAEGQLVCTTEAHNHDDSCYQIIRTEGVEGHTHTDACYEDVLICGKQEHTHTEACYPKETEAATQAQTQAETAAAVTETQPAAPQTETVTEAAKTETATEKAETEKATEAEKPEARTLTVKNGEYTIQVDCPADAKIPKNAVLSVREIKKNDSDYNSTYERAASVVLMKTAKKIETVRFFDLSISVDGKEIQPKAAVNVKITFTKPIQSPEGSEVRAIRLGDDADVLATNANKANGSWSQITFKAKKLTVYATSEIAVPVAETAVTEAETAEVMMLEAGTEETETEAATEAVTEALTEESTEAVTEEVTEAATEEATEAVTEEATEAVTEAQTEESTEEPDTEEMTEEDPATPHILTTGGSDYTVEVTYTAEAGIPEGAELQVREIAQGTAEYESYYQQAMAAVQEGDTTSISFARFFDISFVYEGEEIEPSVPVAVKITYADAVEVPEDGEVKSVHFGDEAQVLDVQTNEKNGAMDEVTFDAESFSVYGILGTEKIYADFLDKDGNTWEIAVDIPEEAHIPSGAELVINEVYSDAKVTEAAEAIGAEVEDLKYVKLLDISIWKDGKELQPDAPVSVSIKLKDADELSNPQIVHFGEETEVLDTELDGDTVSFETTGFSIYAVVDTGSDARLNIEFYKNVGDTDPILTTSITKNQLDAGQLSTLVYDPGVGVFTGNQIFKGWTDNTDYTVDDAENGMDISDVRKLVTSILNDAGNPVTDGQTLKLYGMIFKIYHVAYNDELGVTINTDEVLFKDGDASVPYTVMYTYSPYNASKIDDDDGSELTAEFTGWKQAIPETATETIYENDAEIDLKAIGLSDTIPDLALKAQVDYGHWLIFDENASGASYTAPVFYAKGKPTSEPDEPTRNGYEFDGWYTDKACTTAYTFGGTLSENTTIYAKWNEATTANYTVIIWKQNLAADDYDFERSITISGNVGSTVSTVSQQGTGNNAYARINGTNYQYTGFHLNKYDTGKVIAAEGNTVVNVYYDRTEYTLTFKVSSKSGSKTVKTITAKYQQNISSYFPIVGDDGTSYKNDRWKPQNSNTYNQVLVFIDVMPAEDVTFIRSTANYSIKYMHYYVEALPGQTATRMYKGKGFVLYKDLEANYNFFTEAEDYIDLAGFSKNDSYPPEAYNLDQTQTVSTIWNNSDARHVYCYYLRNSYVINYMDGIYVDAKGAKQDEINKGQLATSDNILYQADISSYNKGGSNYKNLTDDRYVLEGWYTDDACTKKVNFTTMPEGGITVYAKWVLKEYKVTLHPNTDGDTTFKYLNGNGEGNYTGDGHDYFWIDVGQPIENVGGERNNYELIGWFATEGLTKIWDFGALKVNDKTIAKYGELYALDGTDSRYDATNYPSTVGELNLYAAWRKLLDGADGIGVVYDATSGSNAPTDTNKYTDQASAVACPASTAPVPAEGEKQTSFQHWVVQKWNGTEYEDTEVIVMPGDRYTVQKDDSKCVVTKWVNPNDSDDVLTGTWTYKGSETPTAPDSTYTSILEATYTVQLKAVYSSPEDAISTHIKWYRNDGTDAFRTDKEDGTLAINEAVFIEGLDADGNPSDAPSREGYTFIGWARIDIGTTLEEATEWEETSSNWTQENLTPYLYYNDDGTFHLTSKTGSQVTRVAADERHPYQAMFAVWEPNKFTVTIKKVVDKGTVDDLAASYTINYNYPSGDTTLSDSVTLTNNGTSTLTAQIPYGTIFTVTETPPTNMTASYSAVRTTDGYGTALNENVDVTAEDGTTGSFKVVGNTIITVTNTRNVTDVVFKKVLESSQITDDIGDVTEARFTLIDKTDSTKTYTVAPALDGTVIFSDVPYGSYTLSETTAPTGYTTVDAMTVVVSADGVTIDGMATSADSKYTITDTKADTGALTLQKTDYAGTQIEGASFTIAAYNGSVYAYPQTISDVGSQPITGLKVGTLYELKEVTAPDGYVKVTDAWYFQIKLDGTVEVTSSDELISLDPVVDEDDGSTTYTVKVKNQAGKELPHTGGPGTLLYTLSGLLLMCAAAMMYGFRMRRRERRLH